MPKISAIIPAHNAENYIDRCLESIANQSFQDYEVLIMENGSRDATFKKASEYSNKDNRFKAFQLATKGVSNARNEGISRAKGEYVVFIDADDFISTDHLQTMYNGVLEDVDMVIAPYAQYHDQTNSKKHDYECPAGKYGEEKKRFFSLRNVWARLYKLQIIIKNDIRFNTSLDIGEDFIFALEYLVLCDKVALIDNGCYYYCQSIAGQATSTVCEPQSVEKVFYTLELIELMLKKHKLYDEYRAYLDQNIAEVILGSTFGSSVMRKMGAKDVRGIIEPRKAKLLQITLDKQITGDSLYREYELYKFLLKHDTYTNYQKTIRYFRNIILTPLRIKLR